MKLQLAGLRLEVLFEQRSNDVRPTLVPRLGTCLTDVVLGFGLMDRRIIRRYARRYARRYGQRYIGIGASEEGLPLHGLDCLEQGHGRRRRWCLRQGLNGRARGCFHCSEHGGPSEDRTTAEKQDSTDPPSRLGRVGSRLFRQLSTRHKQCLATFA